MSVLSLDWVPKSSEMVLRLLCKKVKVVELFSRKVSVWNPKGHLSRRTPEVPAISKVWISRVPPACVVNRVRLMESTSNANASGCFGERYNAESEIVFAKQNAPLDPFQLLISKDA